MLAAELICPAAAFTPEEHAAILGPLARIVARLTPATVGRVAQWADPAMLAFALAMWLKRILALRQPPPDLGMPLEEATATSYQAPTNGHDATAAAEQAAAAERARAAMGASLS